MNVEKLDGLRRTPTSILYIVSPQAPHVLRDKVGADLSVVLHCVIQQWHETMLRDPVKTENFTNRL